MDGSMRRYIFMARFGMCFHAICLAISVFAVTEVWFWVNLLWNAAFFLHNYFWHQRLQLQRENL